MGLWLCPSSNEYNYFDAAAPLAHALAGLHCCEWPLRAMRPHLLEECKIGGAVSEQRQLKRRTTQQMLESGVRLSMADGGAQKALFVRNEEPIFSVKGASIEPVLIVASCLGLV